MSDTLTATATAAAPLVVTYVLTSNVVITTTITGDARQYATVAVVNGSLTLWSATLTQLDSIATIPFDLVAGQTTIEKGGTFTLTVPTTIQNGNVFAQLTVKTPTSPGGTPIAVTVATWGLS